MTTTCDTWWPADLAILADLRTEIRRAVSRCDDVDTETAELLTTELAANAVTHGRSGFHLTVDVRRDTVRVTVGDDDCTPPELCHAAPDAESGRGIQLVDTFADDWGHDEGPRGKVIWFELHSTC